MFDSYNLEVPGDAIYWIEPVIWNAGKGARLSVILEDNANTHKSLEAAVY
jgi:hypothetical protein